ncbi:MAG: hypothetical protein Q8L48_25360 [Archangium sp.]|nr:hypothetical protein [Archangium sp.]
MAPNMWEQTEEMAKKHDADSSTWLKLANDEDKAVVVFLGEPYPREVSFVDGKYVPFDDAVKAAGHKGSLRVAYNVAVYETGDVRVLEQGVMFFKDLVRVREKYGLEKWAFEVQRHGAAKDPKTTYSILPERQLSAEERKDFETLVLLDLPKLYAGEAEAQPAVEAVPEGPIDPKLATAIVTQLKAMPRQAVDRFLEQFSIKRIKDLPAAQWERAKAFVESLVAEFDAPATTAAEVDPFA